MKLTQKQLRRLIKETVAQLNEKGPLPRPRTAQGVTGHGDIADAITNAIMGRLGFEMVDRNAMAKAKENAQDTIYDLVTDMVMKIENELESQGTRVNWS